MSGKSEKLTAGETVRILRDLRPGEYIVEYTDSTHLSTNTWNRLLRIEQSTPPGGRAAFEEADPFYTLTVATGDDAGEKQTRELGTLNDALAQALVRNGILRPVISPEGIYDIFQLTKRGAVVLVPDTNALSTGVLHWLLRVLAGTQIWLLPVVISLTQVQQRDAVLKGMVGAEKRNNLRQAVRSRTLINASLGLLERYRERYQVLEVDPQLLRYVRPAGRASGDPDEGDVLEDRLLVEAIHDVFRATRSRTEKRVVTSDVLLARILHAEGIPTLFLQTPTLPEGPIPCLFYEPLAKAFLGASLIHLLWDLAHSFGTVRLQDGAGREVLELQTYWPAKTAMEWFQERLMVCYPSIKDAERQAGIQTPPAPAAGRYSTSALPEASFVQVLRLGGALLEGPGTLTSLLTRIPEGARPGEQVARMAMELLLRAGFVRIIDGEQLVETEDLRLLDRTLVAENLDEANNIWARFPPYGALLSALRKKDGLERGALPAILEPALGKRPSKEACERFLRVPVYLGQAWTDSGLLRDGTARPSDDIATEHFSRLFEEKARDGLCPVANLLPELCRLLRISPWAASGQIRRLVQEDRFSDLSFQPAAGKRIVSRDQVVTGSLGGVRIVSIPMDRIEIGGRPVFTVSRRSS